MSQRIRYNKTGVNVLTSMRNFMTGAGVEVKVELDLTAKKYRILDAVTLGELTSGGNTRNVAVLKIQAKRCLAELGVQFNKESRKVVYFHVI